MVKRGANIKILMSEPIPDKPSGPPSYRPIAQKIADIVGRPGTTVDYVGLRKGYPHLGTFEISYNTLWMAQRAYEAEKKGYDAFIIGAIADIGYKECRAITKIPVVAPAESASLLACTLGSKFSIILIDWRMKRTMENLVKGYGLKDRLASLRCLPGLTLQKDHEMVEGSPQEQKQLADIISMEMAKAVNDDGAEAVYISDVPTGLILTTQGITQVEGAPVVDPYTAALKMAEMLVDLQRAQGVGVCKRALRPPPMPGWEKQIPFPTD